MASEKVDVDLPRQMPKFGENVKVYTRRNRKKSPENKCIPEKVAIFDAEDTNESRKIGNEDVADIVIISSPTIVGNNNEIEINKESDITEMSIQANRQEEATLPQQQETPLASTEILIQANQGEVNATNGYVIENGNEALKPIVTKVDDRVRVNLKSGRPKNEIRELKRKFSDELDQIRNVVKKLEDEEVSLSGRSQYSMNDERTLMRVYSDVGSVAPQDSRPFRPLSVSILENRPGFDDVADKEKRTPKANQFYQNSEFLLGSDKLPPEVSNRRWKPYGGKKYGRQTSYRSGADKYISKSFKGCVDLLARLMKHKHGWVFNKPVDVEALNLHDYHVIIKNPMDLGTIKTKLSKHLYNSPKEFYEDVKLTFNNAMTYNPKGHEVHGMAEELLKIFEAKWPAINADYNLALRYETVQEMSLSTPRSRSYDMGLPTPTSRLSTFQNLEIPEETTVALSLDPKMMYNGGSGRVPVLKKPKAKDLHKRDMTYDEKQKLSTNLQSLPPEKLNDIVQIIKKRNSGLSQHDDEIEVDIDSVDAETLWELDRFVLNFKKNLSKKKRRAEVALKARSGATHPVPAISSDPTVMKFQERSQIGEKGNANPLSEQGHGGGLGRTSSSSNSSSGSGSSSSDTESDGSSSNGSERGGSPKP